MATTNVSISIEEAVLVQAREAARRRGVSLSAYMAGLAKADTERQHGRWYMERERRLAAVPGAQAERAEWMRTTGAALWQAR